MASSTNTPQTNSQSTQNYDIDIPTMFKHFFTGGATPNDSTDNGTNIGIDDYRGSISVSATSMKTADLLASLNINPTSNTVAPTPNTTTPTPFIQESRAHTFYRILGLPVISTSFSYYNPGLDVVKQPGITRTIDLAYKINVASNVGKAFESLSYAREQWAANTSSIFSIPSSVEAGVLALTSGAAAANGGVILRSFFQFFTNASTTPFDTALGDQTYNITSQSTLVGDQTLNFNLFPDAFGNNLITNGDNTSTFFHHKHIIAPFMVDPRIDFSIWSNESKTSAGLSKRVAVPFVPSSTYLKTGTTATAQRPQLETIIRNRINQMNNTGSAGAATTTAIDQIQQFKTMPVNNISKTTLSQVFSGTIFQTSQSDYLATYLQIIQSMVQKLVNAIHDVHRAQTDYYFLPQPSLQGPENGCTIRNVIFGSGIPFVQNDFNLYFNQFQALLSSINSTMTQSNATPDAGNFSVATPKNTFDSSTSNSFGDLSSQTNKTITNTRNKVLQDAINGLQIIEMIMGEFSGFGLCDVIAIMGSLYTMNMADLLGFLDIDAYARAQVSLGSSLTSAGQSSITTSMTNLSSSVYQFYQLMDFVFQNSFTNAYLELS